MRLFCKDLINGDFLYAIRFLYTGEWMYRTIAVNEQRYRLITLLTSGQIEFLEPYRADIWLNGGGCGGQASGYDGSSVCLAGIGGCGGYCKESLGMELSGIYPVEIGAGGKGGVCSYTWGSRIAPEPGGMTRLGNITAAGGTTDAGGSGGGGVRYIAGNQMWPTAPGVGSHITTIPFGDGSNFSPHSAGGAGGSKANSQNANDTWNAHGGNGGSNGTDGGPAGPDYFSFATGGYLGGGNASDASSASVKHASFYGSGGAGANARDIGGQPGQQGMGGDGYRGIVYIRIPI